MTRRQFKGGLGLFITILGVLITFFHIWYNSFGLMVITIKSAVHLGTILGLGFLIYPATRKSPMQRPSVIDWILFAASNGSALYLTLNYHRIISSLLHPNIYDYIYGLVLLLIVVEGSRRFVGWIITIIGLSFLLFTYLGPYLPGFLAHQGFTIRRILIRMTMTNEGALGVAVMVSASYIYIFILFSSFLSKTNASTFFNDLAMSIAGHKRGGPAKVSIFASCLTGTISGSAQANVVTTGSFTIPLMKSVGFRPHFAGAVESVASAGGMVTPPIMGAAAFIMCTFLGVPYSVIMIAAFPAAILYYFTLYIMVDLYAKKMHLAGSPKDTLPSFKNVMMERGHMITPLALIFVLLFVGMSPLMAAFYGTAALLAVSFLKQSTRIKPIEIVYGFRDAAIGCIEIAAICGIVGFIIGAVSMTGIGQVIGQSIASLAGDRLWLALVLCMVTAIILGMGLPAPACYMITATIAAPGLIMMGVPHLAAHFFVFYFGCMSGVIPPVALNSYTAAAIAKCDPNKVAFQGLFLASAGILLPFMFVYNLDLLMIDFRPGRFLSVFFIMGTGLFCAAVFVIGICKRRLTIPERILFGMCAILIIPPIDIIRYAALAIIALLIFWQYKSIRPSPATA